MHVEDPLALDDHDLRYIAPGARGAMMERAIADLLQLVREQLGLDVVFVAQFVAGRRVFRSVQVRSPDTPVIEAGQSHALEDSLCARVVDGRIPALVPDLARLRETQPLPSFDFPIGTYLGVPVRQEDGSVYGTLCGFTLEARAGFTARDLKRLEVAAATTARLLATAEG